MGHCIEIANFLRKEVENPTVTFNRIDARRLYDSTLLDWAFSDQDESVIQTAKEMTLISFELPMFAAVRLGRTTKDEICRVYELGVTDGWANVLNGGNSQSYNWKRERTGQEDLKEIPCGAIVSFNGDDYVGISLGKDKNSHKNLMVGLWGNVSGVSWNVPLTINEVYATASFMSTDISEDIEVRYAKCIW